MTDPLKLPLRIMQVLKDTDAIYVVDADTEPIEITEHRADIIVAALTADAEWSARPDTENQARFAACEYYHGRDVTVCLKCGWMPDAEPTPAVVIPPVDYTQIPREYAGKWVLIRIKDQQVVSVADSPEDAMEDFDPESLDFVLTQVPTADAEKGERQ